MFFAPGVSRATSGGNTIDVGDNATTGGAGWNYDRGNKVFTITDSGVNVKGTTSSNRIVVAGGSAQKIITFTGNVTIDMSKVGGESSFALNGANVLLRLQGGTSSTLKGGGSAPGLQAQVGSTLIIDALGAGTASLQATGGLFAAGIGGGFFLGLCSHGEDGGTITINGGNITVNGGLGAAGIGGGSGLDSDFLCGGGGGIGGNITIAGNANVTANGGYGAAGIGGGYKGGADRSRITIGGNASVTAIGGDDDGSRSGGGAGIGSGVGGVPAGTIRIDTTGAVMAIGGAGKSGEPAGANIGEGAYGGHAGYGLQSVTPPSGAAAMIGAMATFTAGSVSTIGSPQVAYLWESNVTGTWNVVGMGQSVTIPAMFSGIAVQNTVHVYGGPMKNGSDIYYVFHPKLTVYTATISIISEPVSQTVTEGAITGALSVAATINPSGTLKYQWYQWARLTPAQPIPRQENEDVLILLNSKPIAGANSASFRFPATLKKEMTYYYHCVVSEANERAAPVVSKIATVSVNPPKPPTPAPILTNESLLEVTTNSVRFSVTSNQDAAATWAIVGANDTCPPLSSVSISPMNYGDMNAAKPFSWQIINLLPDTDYKLCFYAYPANNPTIVSTWEKTFRTLPATCAPNLTLQSMSSTSTSVTFTVKSDIAATGYWAVQEANAADPNPDNMKNSPIVPSHHMNANESFTSTVMGLPPNTDQKLFFLAVSDTGGCMKMLTVPFKTQP
ncbi:MAG: hypothetical protein LBI48_04745 [Burkholderiaceae bacterium]|nr:hypothetical protein [Burkholderiaceae bacterium]